MNHILACKKCCGASKFGTHNGACSRVGKSLSFTKDTGRVLWMEVGEWVASEHAKKQEFRDKFAANYDKAKALEQAKVQGAKRACATVSKEQAVAAKQLFQDQLQEHYKRRHPEALLATLSSPKGL